MVFQNHTTKDIIMFGKDKEIGMLLSSLSNLLALDVILKPSIKVDQTSKYDLI